MTHLLKSLILHCLSFTEGLLTSLFTTAGEAPLSNRWRTTTLWPQLAAV